MWILGGVVSALGALPPAPSAAPTRALYGAPPAAAYLGRVVSVRDPEGLARVQVRLANVDGVEGHDAPLWASVAVPPGQAEAVTITREAGGKVELSAAGNTVTLETAGVTVRAAARVRVEASQVEVSAGMVTVDAGMSRFSGVVQCDTLIANAVVSASYTPGAGNVW